MEAQLETQLNRLLGDVDVPVPGRGSVPRASQI